MEQDAAMIAQYYQRLLHCKKGAAYVEDHESVLESCQDVCDTQRETGS